MPPSTKALRFGLSNTDNSFEAAILADQLGENMTRALPKVGFPPDWVLERSRGPVDLAVYAVTYCNHVETLMAVARRDRRFRVIQALAANSYLPNSSYNEIIERVTPDQRRNIEGQRAINVVVTVPPNDSVEALLADPASYSHVDKRSTLTSAMARVTALSKENPDVGTSFLLAAGEHEDTGPAVLYLLERYSATTELCDVWAPVALSPREVVDLYVGAKKVELLKLFLRGLIVGESQKEPVGVDIVGELIATAPTARLFSPKTSGVKRHIYTPEAVSLLVNNPEWVALLEGQILSEDDLATLIATAPRGTGASIFALLEASRDRLAKLVERLEGPDVLLAEPVPEIFETHWQMALACLSDGDDELVRRLLVFANEGVVLNYMVGDYNNEKGTKAWVSVMPHVEDVPGLVGEFPKAAERLSGRFGTYRELELDRDYAHALIEYAPTLALVILDNPAYSKYIFEYLLSSGAGLEVILEYIDHNQALSLRDAKAALAAL